VIATCTLAVAVAAILRQKAPAPAEPVCPRASVARGPIAGTLALPGRLAPASVVRVGASEPGQVIETKVDVGDHVAKGQVLARLDNLEQRIALVGASGQLTAAELTAMRAERQLAEVIASERLRGLAPLEPPDDDLVDGPIGDAQLAVIAALAQVAKQDALVGLTRRRNDRRTIRAPMAGIVLARSIAAGETVPASPPAPPLFVIASDAETLRVTVEVDHRYVGRVQPGPASIATADHRSIPATVRGLNPLPAPERTSTSYEVTLDVRNPTGRLAFGMPVTAALPMTSSPDTLHVPVRALQATPAGPRLIVADVNGKLVATPVTAGIGDGTSIEVAGAGVAMGQVVLANPDTCPATPGAPRS
jgi:HlyD family secretion protein